MPFSHHNNNFAQIIVIIVQNDKRMHNRCAYIRCYAQNIEYFARLSTQVHSWRALEDHLSKINIGSNGNG